MVSTAARRARLREIGIQAPSRCSGVGVFGARPLQVQVFAHDELKHAGQRCFERRYIHFAISLSRMPVPDFEIAPRPRATGMKQGRPRDQFFVIEIACVNPGRRAVHFAG